MAGLAAMPMLTHMSRTSETRSHRGFTLIELVTAVGIIAILASIALPLTELAVQRSKEQELRRSLREIRQALDAYKQAFDDGRIEKNTGDTGYPATLELLTEGVVDVKSRKSAKMYFLRRMHRDPFATDPAVPAALTWARRSYTSGPDEPREGADVFDVFSRSPRIGLNGIPYQQW
jgi:general secretion pathway protein G